MPEYAKNIKKRFSSNPDIKIFSMGLADRDEKIEISLLKDGTTIFKKSDETVEARLVNAEEFIKKNKIRSIDLIKINIEGGEYALLNNLINSKVIKNIKNIQVQFHNFVPNADSLMEDVQKKLRRTHHLTYQYPYVWENWEIKSSK